MISSHDDYPIHQTSQPVAHPGTSDPNYYDRYWFGGLSLGGEFMFEISHGVYPNRLVSDAALGISRRDGRQYSVLASRRLPCDRGGETAVGPLAVHVVEPLRTVRFTVAPNETGIEADLTFRAANAAVEEPSMLKHWDDGRLMMDTSRFTQFGRWEGYIVAGGERTSVCAQTVYGMRDRSWGIRPVGEPQPGVPLAGAEVFWIWAPVYFPDLCVHVGAFEDRTGYRTYTNAAMLPAYEPGSSVPIMTEPRLERIDNAALQIEWVKGTRRASRIMISLQTRQGETHMIEYEPLLRFHMQGVGYNHPTFAHGTWQGEEAVRGEAWDLSAINPLEPLGLHAQQLCRARMGNRVGVALVEQIVYGPHAPSGFKEFLDGAA